MVQPGMDMLPKPLLLVLPNGVAHRETLAAAPRALCMGFVSKTQSTGSRIPIGKAFGKQGFQPAFHGLKNVQSHE